MHVTVLHPFDLSESPTACGVVLIDNEIDVQIGRLLNGECDSDANVSLTMRIPAVMLD